MAIGIFSSDLFLSLVSTWEDHGKLSFRHILLPHSGQLLFYVFKFTDSQDWIVPVHDRHPSFQGYSIVHV